MWVYNYIYIENKLAIQHIYIKVDNDKSPVCLSLFPLSRQPKVNNVKIT